MVFKNGIYEQIINKYIEDKLSKVQIDQYFVKKEKMELCESSLIISQYLSKILKVAFDQIEYNENIISKQISLCNKILDLISKEVGDDDFKRNFIIEDSLLKAVFLKENFPYKDIDSYLKETTPYSGLTQSELFTGCHSEISLDGELRKEIASSNEINLLVSFIKWSGIRIFEKELREYTTRGNSLKIITTTYLGATDFKAIEFLSSLENTEIKISYNISNERLHAKSYLFYRNTGFHTAYIGSSNISKSALTSGLEWNVKVTTNEISHIIDKLRKTFQTYWENSEFETYKSDKKEKLLESLKKQTRNSSNNYITYFDIKPYYYQQDILDQLKTQRIIHNRYRNLIVAATGTGKTIISCFDYLNFRNQNKEAKLLFIAHRKEILMQSLSTFRAVLKDQNFGELWLSGYEPSRLDYLFVSVQTLNNNIYSLALSSDFYDYIIIDEVHHIAANSYRPILEKFKPKILLGLTATPERMDFEDITNDFCGVISAEIRLTEALNRKLLCPFQYFGISDSTSLEHVKWQQGRYLQSDLTKVLSQEKRVNEIINSCFKYLNNIDDVRALCFCATQDHAQYMSQSFNQAGLKASYLVSNQTFSDNIGRDDVKDTLVKRDINFLFVVDMYNEGVDIPEIDTILFLRPTESLTIFLQQLGRGLRFADNKEFLTVLDFVGNARNEYDYENKFRALIGKTTKSVVHEIENNFPHIPIGCSIVLEKQAKEYILSNIKKAISCKKERLLKKISSYNSTHKVIDLKLFIDYSGLKIDDIYRRDTFSNLCFEANVIKDFNQEFNQIFHRAFYKRWLSCRSISYFYFILRLCDCNFDVNEFKNNEDKLFLMMFYYDVWQDANRHNSLNESIKLLNNNSHYVQEIRQFFTIMIEKIDYIEKELNLPYDCPIKLHSTYTRDQVLAGFQKHKYNNRFSSREGVLNIPELDTELLFVTLNKTEDKYSPSTMYNDYAINERLFHWQSQNSTKPESPKGQSYIHQKRNDKNIILFVREANNDLNSNTMPYICLGKVFYKSHNGSQPMNIIWELEEEIPAFYRFIITKMEIA